jgi:hypothetical protein
MLLLFVVLFVTQLTGHRVSLGVDIDALGRSCGGECGKEDLETALQMVCRFLTLVLFAYYA